VQFPFEPFPFLGPFYGTVVVLMMILPIIIFIITILVMWKICRSQRSLPTPSSFVMQAPSFAVPSSASVRSDGPDIRTVRLPSSCPSCGAALSPEGIDWVGPLEARCSYCGATVRATLERL